MSEENIKINIVLGMQGAPKVIAGLTEVNNKMREMATTISMIPKEGMLQFRMMSAEVQNLKQLFESLSTSMKGEPSAEQWKTMADATGRSVSELKRFKRQFDELSPVAQALGIDIDILRTNIDALNQATSAASIKKRLLSGILREVSAGAQLTKEQLQILAGVLGVNEQGARSLVAAYALLSQQLPLSSEQMTKLANTMQNATTAGMSFNDVWSILGSRLTSNFRIMGTSNKSIREGARIMGTEGVQAGFNYVNANTAVANSLRNVVQQQRFTVASMGAVGNAARSLVNSLFWTGLSGMFTSMSFARLRRQGYALVKATTGLKRVYRDFNDTMKESYQDMMRYGMASEKGRQASYQMEDALERLADAEEAVRSSAEQKSLSMWMFILGVVPSFINSTTNMTYGIFQMMVALKMSRAAKDQDTASTMASTAMMGPHATMVGINTAAYWGWAFAISAATAGLSVLAGLIASGMAMEQAKRDIKELRTEFGITEDVLEGRSLNPALEHTAEALGKVGERAKEVRNLGIGNVDLPVTRIGNMSFTFGDVIVRDDDDIHQIVRVIQKELHRERFARG